MEKYYFDDSMKQKEHEESEPKITLQYLKEKITSFAIYADVIPKGTSRATVIVHKNIGTTMYLSDEFNSHHWLQTNSVKKEVSGDIIKYHFVLD